MRAAYILNRQRGAVVWLMLVVALLAILAPTGAAQNGNGGDAGDGEAEGAGAEQVEESLRAAYQREFVFLNNEIRLLNRRLEEATASGEQRVARARRRLGDLEEQLLQLRRQVDRREEELQVLREEADDTRNTDDVVQQVVEQATARLEEYDIESYQGPEEGSERSAAQLDYALDRSFEVLDRYAGISRSEGTFFLEDGTQVEGEIVSIGRIAAFGISDQGGGTLAPAGDGMLRLIDRETQPAAESLQRDGGAETLPSLPLFIFESLDSLVEVDEGDSFRDALEEAGVIGWVIVVIGAMAVILIIARVVLLVNAARGGKQGARAVTALVGQGKLEAARRRAAQLPGAIGRVLTSTLDGLRNNPEGIEDVISESVLNEQPALDRFRTALGVFAAVAPLLGLLGTVTGMITTFDVITQFGTGDPTLLSGGISEALITTEFGLSVAIPTLLIGNLLSSWSDRITSNMEISALRLVNITSSLPEESASEAIVTEDPAEGGES